jgi:hypothetical protein
LGGHREPKRQVPANDRTMTMLADIGRLTFASLISARILEIVAEKR